MLVVIADHRRHSSHWHISSLVEINHLVDIFFKHSIGKHTVKTCGKAENDEAKSGNDEAKGVPGRQGVIEGDGTM